MKEEQPKLVLDKKTVAHLNNLEMRQVRGGDGDGGGDDTIASRIRCGGDGESKGGQLNVAIVLISLLVKVC